MKLPMFSEASTLGAIERAENAMDRLSREISEGAEWMELTLVQLKHLILRMEQGA